VKAANSNLCSRIMIRASNRSRRIIAIVTITVIQ